MIHPMLFFLILVLVSSASLLDDINPTISKITKIEKKYSENIFGHIRKSSSKKPSTGKIGKRAKKVGNHNKQFLTSLANKVAPKMFKRSLHGPRFECNVNCPEFWVGDGICDPSCNNADCNFDGGDCDSFDGCAIGCVTHWIADGWCDDACNVPECDFDGNDCDFSHRCAPNCPDLWIGDDICDFACNVAECNFDNGDCNNSVQPSDCAPGCPDHWIADNWCDTACNVEECNFDNGDCDFAGDGHHHDAEVCSEEVLLNFAYSILLEPLCASLYESDGSMKNICMCVTSINNSTVIDSLDCYETAYDTDTIAEGLHFMELLCESCGPPTFTEALCNEEIDHNDGLCSPGCYDGWSGDGVCDADCYNEACGFDFGDCDDSTSQPLCNDGCYHGWQGDGFCDYDCYNEACSFDFGDCDQPPDPLCNDGCYHGWQGDGICDNDCYNAACDYDSGDCDEQPEQLCNPGCYSGWEGDGICDEDCYNFACNYDGGDCDNNQNCDMNHYNFLLMQLNHEPQCSVALETDGRIGTCDCLIEMEHHYPGFISHMDCPLSGDESFAEHYEYCAILYENDCNEEEYDFIWSLIFSLPECELAVETEGEEGDCACLDAIENEHPEIVTMSGCPVNLEDGISFAQYYVQKCKPNTVGSHVSTANGNMVVIVACLSVVLAIIVGSIIGWLVYRNCCIPRSHPHEVEKTIELKATKQIVQPPPPPYMTDRPLPTGWKELKDAQGRTYFSNSLEQRTSWTDPRTKIIGSL